MSFHVPQFIGQILTRPREVGAILPSSSFLGQEMTEGLSALSGPVIELGPGPGAITRAIIERGVAPSDVHAIELNPTFSDLLEERFPGVAVHRASATDLMMLDLPRVQAIVSSLPLLAIPLDVVRAILTAARNRLQPGGRIMQYTYGLRQPIPDNVLSACGFMSTPSTTVWRNLPPARVFTLHRRD